MGWHRIYTAGLLLNAAKVDYIWISSLCIFTFHPERQLSTLMHQYIPFDFLENIRLKKYLTKIMGSRVNFFILNVFETSNPDTVWRCNLFWKCCILFTVDLVSDHLRNSTLKAWSVVYISRADYCSYHLRVKLVFSSEKKIFMGLILVEISVGVTG